MKNSMCLRSSLRTVFLIILMIFPMGSPWAAPEQSDSDPFPVMSLGRSKINKNIPQAKRHALREALVKSLEQAVLHYLPPSRLAENLAFINNELFINFDDVYISAYKIIGETKQKSIYTVAVEAKVNTTALRQFLEKKSLIGSEIDLPKVLLFISEKRSHDTPTQFWWGSPPRHDDAISEKSIIAELRSEHVPLIGDPKTRPSPEELGVFFTTILDPEASIAMGKKLKADIVILGAASTREEENTMGGDRAYRGIVTMDIYNTANNLKMASMAKASVVKSDNMQDGIEKSLATAGENAGRALTATLKQIWKDQAFKLNIIKAKIEGTDYLSSFIMLRKTLSTMNDIKDVQTRELTSEQAIVEISYNGNGTALANALMLKSFDSFALKLSDVSEDALTIRFIPKSNEEPVKKSEMEGAFISQ